MPENPDLGAELGDLCRPSADRAAMAAADRLTRAALALDEWATLTLLRTVDKDDLAVALLGVRPPLAARLVDAMGPRAQPLFLRDMRGFRDREPAVAEIALRQIRIAEAAENIS